MKCPKCGNSLFDGQFRCEKCGANIELAQKEADATKAEKQTKKETKNKSKEK